MKSLKKSRTYLNKSLKKQKKTGGFRKKIKSVKVENTDNLANNDEGFEVNNNNS